MDKSQEAISPHTAGLEGPPPAYPGNVQEANPGGFQQPYQGGRLQDKKVLYFIRINNLNINEKMLLMLCIYVVDDVVEL